MNDVRKIIYGTLIGFLVVVVLWIGTLLVFSCGFSFQCNRGTPIIVRTSIPTLIPVKHAESAGQTVAKFDKCEVSARDLIGAWVSAGSPESDPFPFTDAHGKSCEVDFEDVQPLFVENGQWYVNAIGCVSCHNDALTNRSGGLDLTSYKAMQMGAGRVDATAKGTDIFGGGKWEKSTLFNVLVNEGMVSEGHSADVASNDFMLYAGSVVEVTATPVP